MCSQQSSFSVSVSGASRETQPHPPPSSPSPPKRPRLPIPALSDTLARYLDSVKPFIREKERCDGESYDDALGAYGTIIEEFAFDLGPKLQNRLIELDHRSPRNWLADNFWIDKAYLEWREPLLINSNWWLAFLPDDTVESGLLADRGSKRDSGEINRWQVMRAAWMVSRMLEFRDWMDSQKITPESTKESLWLRECTLAAFGVCRIPALPKDTLSARPTSLSTPDSRTIVVGVRDWLYSVTIYEKDDMGYTRIPWKSIEQRLQAVIQDVNERSKRGDVAVPVAILSADGRDEWAKNLRHLLSLSPHNKRIHKVICESLFALSLDSWKQRAATTSGSKSDAHQSDIAILPHLLSIRSSHRAQNRWFDKAMTLVVDSHGQAGMMGEHSPTDALVPSMVADYALVEQVPVPETTGSSTLGLNEEGWERLDWVTDSSVEETCLQAQGRADELIAKSDYTIFHFKGYGSRWIKGAGQLSPDAYIQMAMQLAWYNTHEQTFTATYETALTRSFDAGRTETIRTFTEESRAWVLAMVNSEVAANEKYTLLTAAVRKHVALTRSAASGRGIDRHFLGLRMMALQERGEADEAAKLFDSPLFKESCEWKLSTSGLTAGNYFRGTGFGAMYPDGYGINYLAGDEVIKFGIETKVGNPYTTADGFARAIENALEAMREVCLAGGVERPKL